MSLGIFQGDWGLGAHTYTQGCDQVLVRNGHQYVHDTAGDEEQHAHENSDLLRSRVQMCW